MSAPFGPIVIRCSTLSRYSDCPRRTIASTNRAVIEAAGFKLRRLGRGIGAAIGTAQAATWKFCLAEKAATGLLPPLSVATDHTTQSLADELAGEVEFDGPSGVTHNARDAQLQSLAITGAYYRVIAPTIEPILVEQRLEAEIEPGIILSGQPDLICREPNRVRDLKTGARRPGSHAPQLGGYSLLARTHGLDIESAAIDFVQRVAVRKPQPDPVSHPVPIAPAETAAASIIKHIAGDLATFRNGDPERRILPGDPWAFMANPSSMLCSPKYCPAFGTEFCREGDVNK
jgi:hypothetical protein